MKRRTFLKALSGLPLFGFLKPDELLSDTAYCERYGHDHVWMGPPINNDVCVICREHRNWDDELPRMQEAHSGDVLVWRGDGLQWEAVPMEDVIQEKMIEGYSQRRLLEPLLR